MNPLDPLLNTVHYTHEHLIQPAWEHTEPLLQDLSLQALQSIDPQQVIGLVPDQTWQNVQHFAQVPDYSQTQSYEPAPSCEQPSHNVDMQPPSFEPSHVLLALHHPVGLRTGFEPEYHLGEANKALDDANYHMSQAATHSESANWYAEHHDKVVSGESKAEYEGKWADEEREKANAKLKAAADEMAKATTST